MKTAVKLLFMLFFVFGICIADEIQEDKKKISFSFEVINIDSFPDYVFLAYPVNTSGGTPHIECIQLIQDKPVNLPCKFGPAPNLYAIKKELFNPDNFKITQENTSKVLDSLFANNKNLVTSVKISCIGYADKNAPYSGLKDQYKIESITADTMIINLEKTIKTDKNGKIIDESKGNLMIDPNETGPAKYVYFSLPLLSLVLIVTILMVRKMKK